MSREYRYYPVAHEVYVAGVPADTRGVEICHRKAGEGEEPHCWGVYALDGEGHERHVCDCPEEQAAQMVLDALSGAERARRLKRERDAAVAELRELSISNSIQCGHCLHRELSVLSKPCCDCVGESKAFPFWEWRGLKEAE